MPDQKNLIGGLLLIGASSLYNIYGQKFKSIGSRKKNNKLVQEESDNTNRSIQSPLKENKPIKKLDPLEEKSREELVYICNEFNAKLNQKNKEMQVVMRSYQQLQKEVAELNDKLLQN